MGQVYLVCENNDTHRESILQIIQVAPAYLCLNRFTEGRSERDYKNIGRRYDSKLDNLGFVLFRRGLQTGVFQRGKT